MRNQSRNFENKILGTPACCQTISFTFTSSPSALLSSAFTSSAIFTTWWAKKQTCVGKFAKFFNFLLHNISETFCKSEKYIWLLLILMIFQVWIIWPQMGRMFRIIRKYRYQSVIHLDYMTSNLILKLVKITIDGASCIFQRQWLEFFTSGSMCKSQRR